MNGSLSPTPHAAVCAEPSIGIYLFGVVVSADEVCPPEYPFEGHPVRMLPMDGGVTALVTTLELAPWLGELGASNLSDLNWIGPRAVAHEAIVRTVMAQGHPVLPVRFGTFFSSIERLQAWMGRHHRAMRAYLTTIQGREEWAIKGFLDRDQAVERNMDSDPRVSKLPTSPGVRYLKERRLRETIRRELGGWVRRTEAEATTAIQAVVEAWRPLRVHADATGRPEEVVFNWAVLVDRHQRHQMEAVLVELNRVLEPQGLQLERVGPWPPYSFCPQLEG